MVSLRNNIKHSKNLTWDSAFSSSYCPVLQKTQIKYSKRLVMQNIPSPKRPAILFPGLSINNCKLSPMFGLLHTQKAGEQQNASYESSEIDEINFEEYANSLGISTFKEETKDSKKKEINAVGEIKSDMREPQTSRNIKKLRKVYKTVHYKSVLPQTQAKSRLQKPARPVKLAIDSAIISARLKN